MGSQCHSIENLGSDLYQYPPATVDSTESCTKWNDTNNEIMPRFKLSSLTFRRTLYSSHATWKKVWRWDGAKLSCFAVQEKPNGRSVRALWLKKTHESICKLYSIIGHRLRWESTPLVHIVLFALNKRLFCWQICNKEPTSADIRPCQELVSAIGVSVQINLHEGFTGTKTFDLNESLLLRHRHRQDFPLTRDSEAIYSTKALWRSMLAVIIQLIGYEESSNAIAALLTPWTLLKTGGVFSHSDNKRSSE